MTIDTVIKNVRAFSIVEICLTLAIITAASLFFAGTFNIADRLSKKASSSLEISNVKKNIYQAVDCGRTLANRPYGDPCAGSPGYINLLTKQNKVLVSSSGSQIGGLVVRAYCHAGTNRGIEIRSVKLHPNFVTNLQDISWVGLASPPNPSHYVKDEILGTGGGTTAYDWNHPSSILSAPGAGGICASRFGASVATSTCPGTNYYVKSIDYDSKTVQCESIPVCQNNQTLEFSGNQFTCSSALYDQFTNQYQTLINNSVVYTSATISNTNQEVQNYLNQTNNRFDNLGNLSNGEVASIGGNNDSQCAQLARGRCPQGYLMRGYEARLGGMGNCSAKCVKIAPP